jgi:hypothetical protein
MSAEFSNPELESFLDEALPSERMAAIEEALRHDDSLRQRLAAINGRRDAGVHSLGEIWRRHRLSCPTREQLAGHLLGVLPAELAEYIAFHLDVIACRCCSASLADLRARQSAADAAVEKRRRRYFQSSAGYLRNDKN